MVRTYKQKTDRQKWSTDDMEKAIMKVISKTMSSKKAANTYNIPQSTLEDRIKKRRDGISLELAASKGKLSLEYLKYMKTTKILLFF